MNRDLTIIPDTRIALYNWSGPISIENRMRNVKRIAKFCIEKNITQVLVDLRKQVSNAETMEMFELGSSVPKLFRGISVAVVCQTSDRGTLFGENVAANRGANTRSFATFEEAQRWLEKKAITLNKEDAGDDWKHP